MTLQLMQVLLFSPETDMKITIHQKYDNFPYMGNELTVNIYLKEI